MNKKENKRVSRVSDEEAPIHSHTQKRWSRCKLSYARLNSMIIRADTGFEKRRSSLTHQFHRQWLPRAGFKSITAQRDSWACVAGGGGGCLETNHGGAGDRQFLTALHRIRLQHPRVLPCIRPCIRLARCAEGELRTLLRVEREESGA